LVKIIAMRTYFMFLVLLVTVSCAKKKEIKTFDSVEIETVFSDSLSFRAIEIMGGNSLAFAANKGAYGLVDLKSHQVMVNTQLYDTIAPEFRAVAATSTDFFMLSVSNPALLYKTGDTGIMELVYKEEDEKVFYDAMTFWNDQEGIALGDSMDGCLSIIITRNGGKTWRKLPCSALPASMTDEGAFAASNTNIKTVGDKTWIGTTGGQIYFSENKGKTWSVFETPIGSAESTQGIYSLDFYDENLGVAIGGDYTKPAINTANKAITRDGGKTWQLLADGKEPNYKSCVQFVPNAGGNALVAVGFTGVSYSADAGESWKQLSDDSFYTIRFLNDSIAYAAGKNRIAKLKFK